MAAEQFSTLETERLLLRKFEARDGEPFFNYRTLPQVALYQGERWLSFTRADAGRFVCAQALNEPGAPDTWFQLAVERKDTGALIGDLGLHTLQDVRQAELGYTIAPDHQRNGFAYEAVQALTDYLFTVCALHRITAVTDTRNTSSVRLLEKLGMRREGLFIESVWDKGMYIDEYQYAILYEEYKELRQSRKKRT